MTVYESLAIWLNGILSDPQNAFPGTPTVTDIEHIPNFSQSNGWQDSTSFSNPDDIHTPMLGGQMRHSVTKTWCIKRDFMEFPDRLANEQFSEKLQKAICQKVLRGIMPQDGRKWMNIGIVGGIYPYQRVENNSEMIYQVNLRLEYIE